jgi:2-dehydropantoate 2-reductase
MKEIVLIAEKKGIKLPKNIIENTIEFCKDYPDVKPSYSRDIEKGRRNEGDLFGGTIIRMGKELGVPTPITASIYKKI